MKNSKDCDIVRDLLPNYIENLTGENTNKYIENHIKECENCSQLLNKMRKDITIETNTSDFKKETNNFRHFSPLVATVSKTAVPSVKINSRNVVV